jgi:hypothetical protein
MKRTKTEENAKLLCSWIKNGTRKGIVIEWRKSRTWGMNPHISLGDEREAVHVSGCGYCKESTALAHCLCWLLEPDTEACRKVSRTAGAGVSSVAEELAKHGWRLEAIAEGKNSRAYIVKNIVETGAIRSCGRAARN